MHAFFARYKQQTMQLDMAKQQRDMMITTQAAQMTADAQQHQLQIDMQNKMVPASALAM